MSTERQAYEQQTAQLKLDRAAFNQRVQAAIQNGEKADFSSMVEMDLREKSLRKVDAQLSYEERLKTECRSRYLQTNLVSDSQFEALWQGSLRAEAIKNESADPKAAHVLYASF